MPELDFGNIYSPNGKIIQHRYAQKAVDAGSTMLAMRSSRGAILLVSKPIVSKLHVLESDHRIRRLSSNAYMAYTGILTDGGFISSLCKNAVRNYVTNFDSEITSEYLKKIIAEHMYMFTSHTGTRVIGASIFTIIRDEDEYRLLFADCTGKVSQWNACAAGKGERRAFTELEKLDLENLSVAEMVENGIKILHMCNDPITDPEFDVEIGYISDESNKEFQRLCKEEVANISAKYRDMEFENEY